MDAALPPFITALLQPQRYPPGVQRVVLVETHISWVLLAGDLAYKLKKPVKLPFLDFSTLALRQQACLEELRLNRRLAADIYLDVLPLCHTPQGPQWGAADDAPAGEVIDYAVRMRRFDEATRLDRVCARAELRPAHLSGLARTLAEFHASAASAPPGTRFGEPAQVLAPMLDNFADLTRMLHPSAGDVVAQRLAQLQAWTQARYTALEPLLRARKANARVRECHGDLHLANLVLIDDRVRLFDCLEFNEDLRWIDVASDIAFTYIDLLEHRQPGLANWFADEVVSQSGDVELPQLLHFYAVYRCLVRAKVAAIRANQTHTDTTEVLADLALAERLVAPPPRQLTITHGVSGCGKTFLTDQWLQSDTQPPTLRLRADLLRKRLFGLAPDARTGSGVGAGIYTPEAHTRTYAYLRAVAADWLRAGWSVIVDATFLKRADRAAFHALAQELGASFAILAPVASPEQLQQRITSRQALGADASEATLEVLAQQLRELEPLGVEEGPLIRL